MTYYSFDTEEANQYGVDEAILINNFRFWITKNKVNNQNNYDGRTWTFNSNVALSKIFYFWKPYQIRRILKSTVDQGVFVKGNYNKAKFDQTKWYAFKDEEKWLKIGSNGADNNENTIESIDQPELTKSSTVLEEIVKPIPDSKHRLKTQIVNTDITPPNPPGGNDAKTVIDYLNEKAGKRFKPTAANAKFITARVKEGFTIEDLKAVIDLKCSEWIADKKFNQYLRPSTLFNAEKFNQYIGQIGAAAPSGRPEWMDRFINGEDDELEHNGFNGHQGKGDLVADYSVVATDDGIIF
jgi:uncharacterized phage protein (TIGR02220 family)